MNYISLSYYIFIAILFCLYYLIPESVRWLVLLAGSCFFYYMAAEQKLLLAIFAGSILVSYLFGLLIGRQRMKCQARRGLRRLFLWLGILLSAAPFLLSKGREFLFQSILHISFISWILPLGLSFYTMQIIAYLVDIYRGDVKPERNPLKYTLFVSFFPVIIQGPISRFQQLEHQLMEGHPYRTQNLMKGIQLLLWGFFLKYVIADKAAIFVNAVFGNYEAYSGCFIWIAAFLYSIQLYTDFLSCMTMSQGVAQLFGIELMDNFQRPYFATSIREFWRRWHRSLSTWLRDYIYIPLGGNRRGKLAKYFNLIVTFVVSGLWHGGSWKYLFWGLLHAGYQIAGEITHKGKERFYERIKLPSDSTIRRIVETAVTFVLVMFGWILFRAESLKAGLRMLRSLFFYNPWVLFDNSLFRLGLNQKEWEVLFLAILVLLAVSVMQERGIKLREWFSRQNFLIRWIIYLCAIWTIWIFGTYGFGFQAQDFIYGGF